MRPPVFRLATNTAMVDDAASEINDITTLVIVSALHKGPVKMSKYIRVVSSLSLVLLVFPISLFIFFVRC